MRRAPLPDQREYKLSCGRTVQPGSAVHLSSTRVYMTRPRRHIVHRTATLLCSALLCSAPFHFHFILCPAGTVLRVAAGPGLDDWTRWDTLGEREGEVVAS